MSYIFVLLEQRPERDPIIFFLPWRLESEYKQYTYFRMKKSLFVVVPSLSKRDFLSLNKYSGGYIHLRESL